MYVNDPLAKEEPGRYITLGSGPGAVGDTVRVLQRMVEESLKHPETKRSAVYAVAGVPPTDTDGYIRAIYQTIRNRMSFVPDTFNIEQTMAPHLHSRRFIQAGTSFGDCDDFAALGAAWLMSVGVPARFAVIASPKNQGRWDHIRVEARGTKGWIPLELTSKRVPFGKSFPATRTKYFEVMP